MKKLLSLFFLLSVNISLFSQETVEEPQADMLQANSRKAVDTLDTQDKCTKIIIYNDYTWEYVDLGHPVIDEALMDENFDSERLHAYSEITLAMLPKEVNLLLIDSLNGFFPPIVRKVGSKYGVRKSREHRGADIPLTVGDTIRAAFDGKVRVAEVSGKTGGYGNLVIIRHNNGLETYYGHLSKIVVEENEVLKAGEVLGYGGNTGRSTGPHLHFETRYMGKAFDPERLICFETGTLRDSIFTLKKHYFNIYSHYGQTDKESMAASGRVTHTIRSGDTLGRLAVKYKTTIVNICKLNGISQNTVLRIGRRIIVR